MSKNKTKILVAALELFNNSGVANVRLQHISDACIVSVGNIAYHFPSKAAIVEALYDELANAQRELLLEYRQVPLFENIDHIWRLTWQLQDKYQFFYLDTLEITRLYPSIAERHQQHLNSQIQQWGNMLNFNVARGALQSTLSAQTLQQLAHQIWMTMDLWRYQANIINTQNDDPAPYLNALWSLLKPYFSDTGQREFIQFQQAPYRGLY